MNGNLKGGKNAGQQETKSKEDECEGNNSTREKHE